MVDKEFESERRKKTDVIGTDPVLGDLTRRWLARAQELVWSLQPDLIIETGIARGGSAIFYSSLLELNAICGGPSDARVVAVDVDIRPHNRTAIESHPLSRRLTMIQGSSIDEAIVAEVRRHAASRSKILVCLDSNHTHDHVLAELRAYAPLVTPGSYCVVFDTLIEDLPAAAIGNRPWDKGDNPLTALRAYMTEVDDFEIDAARHGKLQITVAAHGYLRRKG